MPSLDNDSFGVRTWLRFASAVLCILVLRSTAGADETDFKVGDQYRIAVERGGVTQTYDGTLAHATDRWLVLRSTHIHSEVDGIPYLMKLPIAGRLFRITTETIREDRLWIPRGAAKIESHQAATGPDRNRPITGLEPPTDECCMIVLAEKGKSIQRTGNLTASDEQQVTLAQQGVAKKPTETFDRQDILCISFGPTAESNAKRK